jgi:hypothetical protein
MKIDLPEAKLPRWELLIAQKALKEWSDTIRELQRLNKILIKERSKKRPRIDWREILIVLCMAIDIAKEPKAEVRIRKMTEELEKPQPALLKKTA